MYSEVIWLNCVSNRCGNVGKLTRICATVSEKSFAAEHPRKNPRAPFLVLGGFADFIVPGAFSNGHGAIIGLANVAPVSFELDPRQRFPEPDPLILLSTRAHASSSSQRPRSATRPCCRRRSACRASSRVAISRSQRHPSLAPSSCSRSCMATVGGHASRSRRSSLKPPRRCGRTRTHRTSSGSSESSAEKSPREACLVWGT